LFCFKVFPNDFPALLTPPGPVAPRAPHPLLQTRPVEGKCDVLIFHPRHDLTLARLETKDIKNVVEEWKTVYEARGKEEGINYVQIFEVIRSIVIKLGNVIDLNTPKRIKGL